MQRLEVSGAVRPIYGSLGVKRLITKILVTRVAYLLPTGMSTVLRSSLSELDPNTFIHTCSTVSTTFVGLDIQNFAFLWSPILQFYLRFVIVFDKSG